MKKIIRKISYACFLCALIFIMTNVLIFAYPFTQAAYITTGQISVFENNSIVNTSKVSSLILDSGTTYANIYYNSVEAAAYTVEQSGDGYALASFYWMQSGAQRQLILPNFLQDTYDKEYELKNIYCGFFGETPNSFTTVVLPHTIEVLGRAPAPSSNPSGGTYRFVATGPPFALAADTFLPAANDTNFTMYVNGQYYYDYVSSDDEILRSLVTTMYNEKRFRVISEYKTTELADLFDSGSLIRL